MTKYNVTISNNRKKVTVAPQQKYQIGVNYEIPSKSIQYNNIILDDISSGFNGAEKTFSLYDDGDVYSPLNDQQLIVGKNNLFLEPTEDYTVSGSSISFTEAPSVVDDIFIIALVTTADLTRTINFVVDSGNQKLTTGEKGMLTLDVSGVIESWKILTDNPAGRLQVDIQKSDYNSYPNFTTITGNNYATVTDSDKGFDETLTGWNKNLVAGDILKFIVNYQVNVDRFLISFKVKL
jgi:hypothetical protein